MCTARCKLVFIAITVLAFSGCSGPNPNLGESSGHEFVESGSANEMLPNFTVAFLGDQGIGGNSEKVLELVKSEGSQMVLHQGDFDYHDDPEAWDNQISRVLGDDFPYFASVGNHDIAAWPGYQKKLQERLERVQGAECTGDLGVNSVCRYKGLLFVLSGIGTLGEGHEDYLKEALTDDDFLWKVCSWHKNQRLMQVGDKENEVGWRAYEECRNAGAIIATAHYHGYVRTHLMGDFENQVIASENEVLGIGKGRTFAFVSGLGGHSAQPLYGDLASNPWWASVYTEHEHADYGALFCTFNLNGEKNRAHCYFKDISGKVPDDFHVTNLN